MGRLSGSRVEAVCERWNAYGYRRVTHELRREGLVVNHKRVARIMRERGLKAYSPRRFVVTSDGAAVAPFPNLARDFKPCGPNRLWVADLTYIRIAVGFVYLAAILDAWSRRVVGYAIARHMDVRLTVAALRSAIASRRPEPGCIHWHAPVGARRDPQLFDAARIELLRDPQRVPFGAAAIRFRLVDNYEKPTSARVLNILGLSGSQHLRQVGRE